jgi:hypothetical protein
VKKKLFLWQIILFSAFYGEIHFRENDRSTMDTGFDEILSQLFSPPHSSCAHFTSLMFMHANLKLFRLDFRTALTATASKNE